MAEKGAATPVDPDLGVSEEAIAAREQLFALSYVRHGNAARAARDAGYEPATAKEMGYKVLHRPHVEANIVALRTELLTAAKITTKRIVEEMAAIAFSDHRDIMVDEYGNIELAPGAPAAAMRTIKRVKHKLRIIPQKYSTKNPQGLPITEADVEIEYWSKDTQLHNLADIKQIIGAQRSTEEVRKLATLLDMTDEDRAAAVIDIFRAARRKRDFAKEAKKAKEA